MLNQVNNLFGGFAETKELNGIPVVAVANDKKIEKISKWQSHTTFF